MRSLADLFDTNTIPNSAEIAAISRVLAEPGQKVFNLEKQITVLETTLNRLLQDEKQLSKDINAHAALLSPFRHLPPDILREIFYHCLPRNRNPVMSNAEAPMVLIQVCSQWREVALTTPSLWAAIHVAIPENPTSYHRTLCNNATRRAAVTEWLSRSGILPLSLSITLCNNTLIRIPGVAKKYIDTLLTFAPRWRNISFTLYGYDEWPKLLEKIQAKDVPLLESILLAGLDAPCEGDYHCILSKSHSGLFKAPRLRMISVPQRCSCLLQLPIKWSQLTHFDLGHEQFWSLHTLMLALSQCSGLQHVHLRLPSRPPLNPLNTLRQFSLDKLISLSVIDSYQLNSCTLFRNLRAPNLRHLAYERYSRRSSYSRRSRAFFNEPFVAFCNQIVEPLEELQLHTTSITDSDVMGFLSLFPGLKRLSMICPGSAISAPNFGPSINDQFILGNEELARFTKGVVVDKGNDQGSQTDTSTESDFFDEILPVPFTSVYLGQEFGSKFQQTPVCPKLEVFHCIGALFTLSALLQFLQARSSPDPSSGMVPLRRAVVTFNSRVKDSKKVYKTLKKLSEETGMVIELGKLPETRPFTPSPTNLPYEGLPENDEIPGMRFFHAHQPYFGF